MLEFRVHRADDRETLLLARWLARYPLLGHHHRYPRRVRALRARQPCTVSIYRASLHPYDVFGDAFVDFMACPLIYIRKSSLLLGRDFISIRPLIDRTVRLEMSYL